MRCRRVVVYGALSTEARIRGNGKRQEMIGQLLVQDESVATVHIL